jgi:hypothetical protein
MQYMRFYVRIKFYFVFILLNVIITGLYNKVSIFILRSYFYPECFKF